MSTLKIKGFVDVTVYNEDGTVKEHQYKENTLTHAAIASMFCGFLFRGDSPETSSTSADSNNYSTANNYVPYMERGNTYSKWGNSATFPFSRDMVLRGTDGLDPISPVFSFRQPTMLGVYCLNAFVQNKDALNPGQLPFDFYSQVAPYNRPDGMTKSPDIVFFNEGSNSAFYANSESENNLHFTLQRRVCFFNIPEMSFTLTMKKSAGAGTVKSIVWGASDPTTKNNVFDVRSRLVQREVFQTAGRSPFYATEQRLIQDTTGSYRPHTILWQDSARPSTASRTIYGYDITQPGANVELGSNAEAESFTTPSWHYMDNYMQGVVIGNDAFGIGNDTGNNFVVPTGNTTITKTANWKTNPVTSTLAITFDANTGGGYTALTNTIPVLVHNLDGSRLEVFFTTSYNATTHKFRVGVASVNPSTFVVVGAISYYTSDYCISNYRRSMVGTSTAPENTNYPRARSVSGFRDYNVNGSNSHDYYLPYTRYYDVALEGIRAVGVATADVSVSSTAEAGTLLKLGLQCTLAGGVITPTRLFLLAYPLSGQGNPTDTNNQYEYYYTSCCGIYSRYKYVLWGYAPPASSGVNAISQTQQFIPLTGNGVDTGSFSIVSPSQAMCGLDLDNPVTKGESESLQISYGWRIAQE